MAERSSEKPHPILDAIDAGLIVLDRDHRIVRWNVWIAAASRRSEKDVLGRLITDIFPNLHSGRLIDAITSACGTGMSSLITHALHPSLFPLTTSAGQPLLHDVMVSAIGQGEGRECLVHIADVTMAVRRERYLRARQNARYEAIIDSATDVILTLDADGVIRLTNPAASVHFGYEPGELVGQNAAILFEDKSTWAETWRAAREKGRLPQPVELVARRKDSTLSYFEVSASRWQLDAHNFVTAILRDTNERRAVEAALRASEERSRIAADALAELNLTLERRVHERTSQLLQVEEALRQSQKMEAIGQLTGGIAHDFNNLLQGIIGALNMVQKRVTEGRISDVDRFLKGAAASAERASTLTHRLLAFSRRQPVDPRPVDLNQLIGTIEELLRRSIGEKVKMNVVGGYDLWLVRCDVNQLENALLNLAINARDAMPDGGTLTIATSNKTLDAAAASIRDVKPGAYVCIEIKDTGVGMPADVQARAFDPFFTTKPIGQGTGLGLSMIYGFVRQSDGSVRIDSEVGVGTTIEICMPQFVGNLEQDVVDPAVTGDERMGNNEIVLVVEDEDIVRMLVVEVPHDLGYRALEATDGPSALRILQSAQRVDLLITDIGLPEVNGRQVADAALERRPNLKVLFMTGYAESAASSEFLQNSMQIISKPFTMDKLAAKIRDIIADTHSTLPT